MVLNKGPKPKGYKFLPKGNKIKFIGYSLSTKGYRLYNSATRKNFVSRDVIFFQQSFEKIANKEENNLLIDIFKDFKTCNVSDEKGDEEQRDGEQGAISNNNDETDRDEMVVVENKRKRGRPKLLRDHKKGRRRKVYCTEDGVEMLYSIIDNPETLAEAL